MLQLPKSTAAVLAGLLLAVPASFAQEGEKSAAELAKELANPNSPLATLNFKHQLRLFGGDLPNAHDQWSYTMLFQPALPFSLDDGGTLFWRPAVPLILEQPIYNPATRDYFQESGIGDIGFDLAYGRTTEKGLLWATGLVTTLPTATSDLLGTGRWSIGPELILGKLTEKYVVGVFPSHQWDVAGWSDKEVNLTNLQVFATYLPGGGWNVGSSPIMSYDWNTEQWNIPANFSIGKTVMLGGKPWKISAEANYYFERSDTFAAEWMVGINISPVVKNPLAGLFGK